MTLIKRTSKDTEIYRASLKEKRKVRNQIQKEKGEIRDVGENERVGINYWRQKFREMAEKATKEIPGVSEHVVRMEKGRQKGEQEKIIEAMSEIETKGSAEMHLQERTISSTTVRETIKNSEKKRKRDSHGDNHREKCTVKTKRMKGEQSSKESEKEEKGTD